METARDSLREAVERDPNDPVARNDLAVILCLLGEHTEALAHVQHAIALRPELVVAYINAAVVAGCRSGHEAALPWIDAALNIEPDNLVALLLRSNTLAKLDRGLEALESARRAVELHPQSSQAHEMLAVALQATAQYEVAVLAFDRAQSLGRNGITGVRKAAMLLGQGRQPEALREIDAVLAENPMLAVAWYTRGLALDFKYGTLDIGAMENVLRDAPSLTFDDRVQLHFALGRAKLACGQADSAFAYLVHGNRMKRESIDYDIEADERSMRAFAELFSAEVLSNSEDGNPSEVPVFVVGMPRSGTSLIEQILASHPLIFGAGELPFIGRLAGRPDAAGEYLDLVTARAPDAVRIVDKMPFNFLNAGFIRTILPNARIIHCRRDPLDTCLSCYLTLFDNQIGFCYDQSELGRYYRAYETLMEHWGATLPRDRFLEVEYENVVADLEGEARRLVDFCGVTWDDRCLDFHKTKRPVLTASMNQVRQPIYSSSVGRSKDLVRYLAPLVEALGL